MEKQSFDPWSWRKNTHTICIDIYVPFIQKHGIQQSTTLLEVKGLFATLTVEFEATVVK